MIDKLIDFVMIVVGIPKQVAECALHRRSFADRIADRVMDRLEAQNRCASQHTRFAIEGLDKDLVQVINNVSLPPRHA